ncbi:Ral guanine nucleotide dissociation stimulator-like 1 [Rhizopus stolonifer]|uniref:Ral guanine nucleotide dissociation stimulator-like 1 n=1 Tax=Rhizopus stolonifer TaxID=4846 RepID=A0A367KM27_RHIST|nr:Ral guanine nucleotide dissociation stimulator-like 1 [Rhizopus stolonifer]
MTDDQVTEAVELAIELEEKGQYKATASQKAMTALNDIKFVHSSIISSPKHYHQLILSIKTCLSHIEDMIEHHSPSAVQQHDAKIPRPPLPPKPSRIQKPLVPPKPVHVNSRPSSPTLKENELLDNSSDNIIRPRVPENSRPTSLPPLQHPATTLHKNRPHTEFVTHGELSVNIVAEGEIDPNYLVPAQTNAGDSLAPSSSVMNVDHVPLIPAPPLLTTHRNLQAKVDELEDKIRHCRTRKQAIAQGQPLQGETMTEDALDQTIAQYLRVLAELKVTLNGVRTIYMSAATIPSILQFGAHVIAYQITLIESAIFSAIPPLALLEHSSKHPHPRIVASTDFFNYITRCIEHAVLLPQEASSRAQLIHYWIKVASPIISALNTPPVQRLKRTWAYIPKKSSTKLEALNELMSEANNYGHYREHMGMVNTAVVNGKSVQSIRDEHFSRPTVPFLGTFIHDITYLLAAFKSNPQGGQPENEPRIREVLQTIHRFQTGPRYTPNLPSSFLKSSQKHHFRPALSNALHRGASRIQRFSGSTLFGFDSSGNSTSNNSSSTNLSHLNVDSTVDDDDNNLEEQQKMATQYILMRSWVSQNTVDELSHLREPSAPKNNTSLYNTRSSSSNAASMHRTSSVLSNTSRFSTGSTSLNTGENNSRPTSMDEEEEEKRKNGFFAQFRGRPVTIHEGLERMSHTSDSSSLSRDDSDPYQMDSKRTTWNGGPPSNQAPVVPPRPLPKPPSTPSQNDEFKAALAQRLAQVSER